MGYVCVSRDFAASLPTNGSCKVTVRSPSAPTCSCLVLVVGGCLCVSSALVGFCSHAPLGATWSVCLFWEMYGAMWQGTPKRQCTLQTRRWLCRWYTACLLVTCADLLGQLAGYICWCLVYAHHGADCCHSNCSYESQTLFSLVLEHQSPLRYLLPLTFGASLVFWGCRRASSVAL